MKATARRLFTFFIGGALLGDVISLIVGPSLLTWNNSPSAGSAMCNCVELTQSTAAGLVKVQLTGIVLGGVVATVFCELIRQWWLRMRGRRAAQRAMVASAEANKAAGG